MIGEEGALCFFQAENKFFACCSVLEVFLCHAICLEGNAIDLQSKSNQGHQQSCRGWPGHLCLLALVRCGLSSHLVIHFAGWIGPGLGASNLVRAIRQNTGARLGCVSPSVSLQGFVSCSHSSRMLMLKGVLNEGWLCYTVFPGYLWGSGAPPWIPKSTDAQASCLKWRSVCKQLLHILLYTSNHL